MLNTEDMHTHTLRTCTLTHKGHAYSHTEDVHAHTLPVYTMTQLIRPSADMAPQPSTPSTVSQSKINYFVKLLSL